MDIFTEIKVVLFKRHSVTLWCKPQGTAHTLLFLLHTQCPGTHSTSITCPLLLELKQVEGTAQWSKSLTSYKIHQNTLYSSSFPCLWQMSFQSMARRHICFLHHTLLCICGLRVWGYLGGCCLAVWSFYIQCFGGLLTKSYGSQMFVFGPNLIGFFCCSFFGGFFVCFFFFNDPTLWR